MRATYPVAPFFSQAGPAGEVRRAAGRPGGRVVGASCTLRTVSAARPISSEVVARFQFEEANI
jgi:hypothetical protein